MAHPLNDLLNRVEGRKAIPCDEGCVFFRFPHLARPCVLSEVFSVRKGEPCFEYKPLATLDTDRAEPTSKGK